MKTRGKGVVPDDKMAEAAGKLHLPIDDWKMADRIADFFKQVRA